MGQREIIDLYDAHARALVTFFARRTRDPQLALDLLGETFLVAFEQRERCRGQSEGQRAGWLYRIAANQLANFFRRDAGERRAVSRFAGQLRALTEDEVATIDRLTSSTELEERVSAAFKELSEEQRAAIRLHVIEERTYTETSEMLGLSEDAARARVSRGLRILRGVAAAHRGERR